MANEAVTTALTTTTPAQLPVNIVADNHPLAMFLNPAPFAQLQRVAAMFAASDIVPKAYQGKPANAAVAIEMASRMGINPFAVMQNLAVINGRPSMEAKLIIALINQSGKFKDDLEFVVDGSKGEASDGTWNAEKKVPFDSAYRVRSFATRSESGKVVYGPWITWTLVMAEKWHAKDGSKWLTMPEIMFMYRAASFFGKLYAPDITMGLQSTEEMRDEVIDITPTKVNTRSAIAELEYAASELKTVTKPAKVITPKPGATPKKEEAVKVQEAVIPTSAQDTVSAKSEWDQEERVDTATGEIHLTEEEAETAEEWPLCPVCEEAYVQGACRNSVCPEARPLD